MHSRLQNKSEIANNSFLVIVMVATEEEMISAKIPLENRDYCAHILMKYQKCRNDVWPWAYKCHHEKHEYMTCEFEE